MTYNENGIFWFGLRHFVSTTPFFSKHVYVKNKYSHHHPCPPPTASYLSIHYFRFFQSGRVFIIYFENQCNNSTWRKYVVANTHHLIIFMFIIFIVSYPLHASPTSTARRRRPPPSLCPFFFEFDTSCAHATISNALVIINKIIRTISYSATVS